MSTQVQRAETVIERNRLKPYIDALATAGEAVVEVSEDGFWTQAVDPANILQVETELDPAAFDSLDIGEPVRFGYKMDDFSEYLERLPDASVQLTLDPSEKRFQARCGSFTWDAAWYDPDSIRKAADVSLDPPAEFQIHRDDFHDIVSWAKWIDKKGHIVCTYDDDGLKATVEGETDAGVYHLEPGELPELVSEPDTEIESILSGQYLRDIDEALHDLPMWVQLGDSVPIIVTQPFADGMGQATYYVAPRIREGGS